MDSLNLQTALTVLDQTIASATPAQCPELLGELERLKAMAWGRMTAPSTSAIPAVEPTNQGRYLTVEEVSARFGLSDRWLYRHKKQMPHSQPSRKVLLFPEQAIRKWFASRKGA